MFVDSRSLVVILGVAVAVVVVVAAQATPAFADTALQQGQGYAAQSPNLRSKQVDSSSSNRRQQVVVVEGGAYEFAGNDKPVTGATITALERPGWQVHTDDEGQFSFTASVNEVLTLVLSAEHMKTTQYSTVTVPPGGLTGHLSRIYFQVPSSLMYDFLSIVMPEHPKADRCQFVVTVSAFNLTVFSFPQGEPNSTAIMTPPAQDHTFYFGTWGKLSNDTNPFSRGLTKTSWDGGVVLMNVPVSKEPYLVTATKPGYSFTTTKMICAAPGVFVNAPPPAGPQVVQGPPQGLRVE